MNRRQFLSAADGTVVASFVGAEGIAVGQVVTTQTVTWSNHHLMAPMTATLDNFRRSWYETYRGPRCAKEVTDE